MQRRLFVVALAAGVLTGQELTLDQVIEKSLAATGGTAAIQAVKSVTMTSKMIAQGGQIETSMRVLMKRPALMRTETELQGKSLITTWNGIVGWSLNPFAGQDTPQKMDDQTAQSMAQNADMDSTFGGLDTMKKAGMKLELLGKEDADGKPAYKVKVTRKDASAQTYYIDAATFLPSKLTLTVSQMGQTMTIDSFMRDYRKVNGVMMAHEIEQQLGAMTLAKILVQKIEVNVPMDDKLFTLEGQ